MPWSLGSRPHPASLQSFAPRPVRRLPNYACCPSVKRRPRLTHRRLLDQYSSSPIGVGPYPDLHPGRESHSLRCGKIQAACFRGVSPCPKGTKVPAAGELDVTIGQDPEAHGFLASAFIKEQISGQVVELA